MRGVLHDHIELKGVTWLHEKPEIVEVSYIDIKDGDICTPESKGYKYKKLQGCPLS
jgi:hypothetical protein